MAGRVRATVHRGNGQILSVLPQPCPASNGPQRLLCCVVVDLHYSHANLCPFLYGLVLQVNGSTYDVRALDAVMQWAASQEVHGAQWTPLCLRMESKDTEPGARLRP